MAELRARLLVSADGSPALYLFSPDGRKHATIERVGGDTVLGLVDRPEFSTMTITLAEGGADFAFPSAMLEAFLVAPPTK